MIQVKFKKLHQDAKVPTKATMGAAGFDLYACVSRQSVVWGLGGTIVSTGIAVEIPEGFEGQVRGRSGLLFSSGVHVPQTGTIDCDYRGELRVYLALVPGVDVPVKISHGDRIAQLVIAPVPEVEFVEVDELSDTRRGQGGFGSTGK